MTVAAPSPSMTRGWRRSPLTRLGVSHLALGQTQEGVKKLKKLANLKT